MRLAVIASGFRLAAVTGGVVQLLSVRRLARIMRWVAYSVIVLFFVAVYPYLRTEKSGHFISQTWFGFLLVLGGILFLVSAKFYDHVTMNQGRFRGAVLDRWQIAILGLLCIGFGVAWIYGPLRRRFRK